MNINAAFFHYYIGCSCEDTGVFIVMWLFYSVCNYMQVYCMFVGG